MEFDRVGKCFKGDIIRFQRAAKTEVMRVNMVEEPVVKWSGQGQASKDRGVR